MVLKYRLELTTTEGHVFLSPFVYKRLVAEKKLVKIDWLVDWKHGASMRLVKVKKYPAIAEFTSTDATRVGNALCRRIRVLEEAWAKLDQSIKRN